MKKYKKEKAFECRARIDKDMNDFLLETAYKDDTSVSEVMRDGISLYRAIREAIEIANPRLHGGKQGLSKKERAFIQEHLTTKIIESQKHNA